MRILTGINYYLKTINFNQIYMMKKSIKFIPAVLGLFALASCNSYDYDVVDTEIIKKDGALTVITDVDFDADAVTRSAAGYARITNGTNKGTLTGIVFTDGDKIKVYDQTNWRYQTWVKSDDDPKVSSTDIQTIFDLDAEEGDKYELTDGGYAVYPEDLAAFYDEERTQLTITNFVSKDGELTLEEIEGGEYPTSYDYLNGNTKLFNCPVPMWGKAENGVVKMNAMVGLLKVNFTGVKVEKGATIVITVADDKALWASEATVNFSFDGEDAAPVVDADVLVNTTDEKQNILTINLPAFDGDTYLLVPVAVGEYESITLEYFAKGAEEATEKTTLQSKDADGKFEVEAGIMKEVALTVSANESIEGDPITPETLQKALNKGNEEEGYYEYADFGRNVVVDVKKALSVGGQNHKAEFTTLTLPALKNTVTFNLTDGINTMETGKDPVLTIEGGEGSTGKLIINIPADKTSTADIVVNAKVEVEINYQNATALDKEVTVNGKAILKGNYTTVNTTEAYTIGEGVTIATALNAGGELTVNSAIVGTINTSNDVAIAKGVEVASLVLGSAEEDADAVEAINLTVAEEPAAAAEDAATTTPAYATVAKLTINKVTTVNATDLSLKDITKADKTGATKIHTEGVSEIKNKPTDAGKLLSFSSVYNGSVAPTKTFSSGTCNIYTAAELGKVKPLGGESTYNLLTDITSAEGAEWNSITIGSTNTNKTITFDGNGHTIAGVALKGENVGMFNLSMTATTTVNIKDLIVTGLSYTGNNEVDGVGALAGIVKGGKAVNITNVNITGTSIGSTAENSCNIGGFIGQVDGVKVTLTGSKLKLTGNIIGHYNLGGTIGSVASGATVTITTSPIVIGNFDVYNNTDLDADDLDVAGREEHAKYGTVGMVIGSILGYENTVTLGTAGSSAGVDLFSGNKRSTAAQKKELHFDYNFKYASSNGKKSWFSGGLSAVGYSPSMIELDETTGEAKENGKSSTVTYLGTEYKASSINSYTTTAY